MKVLHLKGGKGSVVAFPWVWTFSLIFFHDSSYVRVQVCDKVCIRSGIRQCWNGMLLLLVWIITLPLNFYRSSVWGPGKLLFQLPWQILFVWMKTLYILLCFVGDIYFSQCCSLNKRAATSLWDAHLLLADLYPVPVGLGCASQSQTQLWIRQGQRDISMKQPWPGHHLHHRQRGALNLCLASGVWGALFLLWSGPAGSNCCLLCCHTSCHSSAVGHLPYLTDWPLPSSQPPTVLEEWWQLPLSISHQETEHLRRKGDIYSSLGQEKQFPQPASFHMGLQAAQTVIMSFVRKTIFAFIMYFGSIVLLSLPG